MNESAAEQIHQSEFDAFLAHLGKTLSRIKIYSLNHPLVAEAIEASFVSLQDLLSREKELAIAWSGDKLLLNGIPITGTGNVKEIMGGLFERYQLHSITFQQGVTMDEMGSFYKLLTVRQDQIRDPAGFKSFLEQEGVKNIQADLAYFAKVAEKQEGSAGTGAGMPKTEEEEKSEREKFLTRMESEPLESMLWDIILRAVPNPDDQKKLYEIIVKKIQGELMEHVEKAAQQLKIEKLQVSNEQKRTESVLNTVAEGSVVVDDQGRIVTVNPAAEKIYGMTLSELKGKKIVEIAKEELMVALASELTNSAERELSKDVQVQSTENTLQTLRNSIAVVQNPDGKIVGMVTVLSDVTKQKELQRMQAEFLSHVTHELRSPLTSIKAALNTITDDEDNKLNPQIQQILGIANRNIDRLARLINDILDFGKAEAGKITLRPTAVDLKKLLQDAIQSLESWAKTKNISMILSVPEQLPGVRADPDRITQVLVNLIANGLKFTPANGKITVGAQQTGPQTVRIAVTDSGPGISREDQSRLFGKFSQLGGRKDPQFPGTGLGLYISKTIVELHNGRIGLESEPGKGSMFHFTLPAEAPRAAPGVAPRTGAQAKKRSWLARFFGRSA